MVNSRPASALISDMMGGIQGRCVTLRAMYWSTSVRALCNAHLCDRELPFVFGSTPGGFLASDRAESAARRTAQRNGSGYHLTLKL